MAHWETSGQSDEWYTPAYIFEALGCHFNLDVAAPLDFARCHVPADEWLWHKSLELPWSGFVWMNPPFGARNGLKPWLNKFFDHGNGIALVPDRTSAPWWQEAAKRADAVLFVAGKIRFQRPDGSTGNSPSTGTCLLASGKRATRALKTAASRGLGFLADMEG
nr:MAG TPA: DNA N-6-adenine-methyltransferase [Caudoviricetes sp.]